MTSLAASVSALTLAQATDLYNLVADKPVKKFKDKPTAHARLEKVLAETQQEVFVCEGEYDVRPVAAPEPEKTEEPVVVSGQEVKIHPELAFKPKAPKAEKKAASSGKRGPAPTYTDDMSIKVLVDNPKRAGSASWTRFQLYFIYKTVGEFLAAGGLRADLKWDEEHNYIKVGG